MINTFKSLNPESEYRLTKIHMKRTSGVFSGERVTGTLQILEVSPDKPEEFMIRVSSNRFGNNLTYIRTSPVVCLISKSPQSVVFETEGGIYLLEVL